MFLIQSCSVSSSEYRKLMDPIKKIKLEEQKLGKPAAVFDGIAEPNFPDENENNKTLEGVDSNRDGVRDDIEIWINRTAEDQYIRIELKEYYQTLYAKHVILINSDASDAEKNELDYKDSKARRCLSVTLYPYKKIYLSKQIEIPDFYIDRLYQLTFNTSKRSRLVSAANSYQYQISRGVETGDYSFCSKKIPQSYFVKVIKDYQEQAK